MERPRVRTLLFALLVSGTVLLTLEGVARLVAWVSPPAERGAAVGLHRSHPEHRLVILVGESTIFGVPVPRFGFVAQFRYLLDTYAPAARLEVHSIGVPGVPSERVRALAVSALEHAPDLLVVQCGHNEFRAVLPRSLFQRRAYDFALIGEMALLWRNLSTFLDLGTKDAVSAVREPLPHRQDALRRHLTVYEENLRAIVTRAEARGVPLVLLTSTSNLADWAPADLTFDAPGPPSAEELSVVRAKRALREHRYEVVAELVGEGLRTWPEDAWMHFLAGKLHLARGEYPAAKAALEQARDLDPIPLRALSPFNSVLRTLATENEKVLLLDLEELFRREAMLPEVPGYELFCDFCHPSPLGNTLIARELVLSLSREGRLLEPGLELPPAEVLLNEYLRTRMTPTELAEFREKYLLDSARAAMVAPVRYLEGAAHFLEQLRRLAPRSWKGVLNAGALALLEGKKEEGLRLVAAAIELRGKPLDRDMFRVAPCLEEGFRRVGLEVAEGQPRLSTTASVIP